MTTDHELINGVHACHDVFTCHDEMAERIAALEADLASAEIAKAKRLDAIATLEREKAQLREALAATIQEYFEGMGHDEPVYSATGSCRGGCVRCAVDEQGQKALKETGGTLHA